MKRVLKAAAIGVVLGSAMFGSAGLLLAQAAGGSGNPAVAPAAKTPPLQLHSLTADTFADPFPAVNKKFFTAASPAPETVDSYLHALLGFDPSRIWRVVGIQTTTAPGVSKVTALVSEKAQGAKVQEAVFYVLPDGKHLIADQSGPQPFGADPYVAARAAAVEKADGPWVGAAAKQLLLVEFSDMQCPHCKDAQSTMKRLAEDFPQARIVYENYPLTELHPYAEKAALYGVCVAKTSNAAFFTYLDAVFATQGGLTEDGVNDTLNNAVTKAGGDPATVAACAATPDAKLKVEASVKLGNEVGVNQTPMLLVNGRLLTIGATAYETLRAIITFQAGLNGVTVAPASVVSPK